MRCRACNSRNTRVTSTDQTNEVLTKRYCRCLDCKAHYQTVEKYLILKPGPKPGSKTGSKLIGSANHQAVLTESNVIQLRRMYREGMNQRQLAQIFGVCSQHVSRIVTYKIWTHV